jgi:hypothetical protein
MPSTDIFLETGKKRVFAGAVEWPGWCRGGRDEQSALQSLLESAPRYEHVIKNAALPFTPPRNLSAFHIIERVEGNATTDFGAPNILLACDALPVLETDLLRLTAIFAACWAAFDLAVQQAVGKVLRTGPRGGGRRLDAIFEHVLGSAESDLTSIGASRPKTVTENWEQRLAAFHSTAINSLAAAARGEIAHTGPRGGKRWSPRTYVRRSAWHILDHVWEIEDRVINQEDEQAAP